jgi:hypothetical protein
MWKQIGSAYIYSLDQCCTEHEASSNVLVVGFAKGVDISTTVLGRRDFVLKLPKHYCSSLKHRPLHVVQYGAYTLAHHLTTGVNTRYFTDC